MTGIRAPCLALAMLCSLPNIEALMKFNRLTVKYGFDLTEAFYEIPTDTSSPLMKDYVMVEPEAEFRFLLDFYCYTEDPRVCFMFDKKGRVAGCQISMLKEDVEHVRPQYYNYSANSNYIETNFFGSEAYSQRTYFTNPEYLNEDGRPNADEIVEGLWTYLDGKLVEIPRSEPNAERFGDFYKQGCLQGMGQHYFYKVTSESSCDRIFPLFPLYSEGGLVGYGMANVGLGTHGSVRGWYEHPPKEALLIITPDHPQCLYDLALMYGITSMHVYLVDEPWKLSCPH